MSYGSVEMSQQPAVEMSQQPASEHSHGKWYSQGLFLPPKLMRGPNGDSFAKADIALAHEREMRCHGSLHAAANSW